MDKKYQDCRRMRKSSKKELPQLRFPQEKLIPWNTFTLSEIGQILGGLSGKSALDFGGGELYVTYKQVYERGYISLNECERVVMREEEHQTKLAYGDILVTMTSETRDDIGRVSVIGTKVIPNVYLNSFCFIFRPFNVDFFSPSFAIQIFQSVFFLRQVRLIAQGYIRVNISKSSFANIQISIPATDFERKQIADCLSSIDEQIEKQQKTLDALRQHKQALMQQLFPQRGDDTPGLRFTKKKRWKYKSLKTLAVHCTKKNVDSTEKTVLTNSAQFGVICQQEYFERDIVSQNNLKNYYIVEKGDYVYNPRVSIAAPVGPVSKNKISRGVISPLYLVFRFNQETDDFYVFYFQSQHWQIQLKKIANSGARFDRMSISTFDFFDIKVPDLPDEESEKISSTLTSLDNLIDAYLKKYDLLIKHKRGLMQQLFPN